jgi:hypothetical protein
MTAALDPARGDAPRLICRMLDDDLTRLERLARQRGGNKSALVRELLRRGLDQLERENTGRQKLEAAH